MPLTRRKLLGAASLAGGLLWSKRLPAADNLAEFSFVIVSDTHLGRNDNEAAERNWLRAVEEINNAQGDFVLHLGDVVDGGRPALYPRYAEIRKTLAKPIHEIPGNHDPVALFEKHIAAPIDRAFDHAGVRFLLLNNSHTDSHDGFFTADQLTWLARECETAAAKDLKLVIACHVPVHKNLHPDRGWHVKPADGQTAFYELIGRHNERVLALVHGHFHNGIRGWRDRGRLVEVLCPSVCYNQDRKLEIALKEGKTTGFFVEELRPGYLLVTLGAGRLTLRYKPLGAAVHGEYSAEWS